MNGRRFTHDYLLTISKGVDANPTPLSCQFTMLRGDNALSSEGFYKLPISFGVHSVNVDRQTTTDLQSPTPDTFPAPPCTYINPQSTKTSAQPTVTYRHSGSDWKFIEIR